VAVVEGVVGTVAVWRVDEVALAVGAVSVGAVSVGEVVVGATTVGDGSPSVEDAVAVGRISLALGSDPSQPVAIASAAAAKVVQRRGVGRPAIATVEPGTRHSCCRSAHPVRRAA
jgi:hypothetical protein